jgi:hypothetical protein
MLAVYRYKAVFITAEIGGSGPGGIYMRMVSKIKSLVFKPFSRGPGPSIGRDQLLQYPAVFSQCIVQVSHKGSVGTLPVVVYGAALVITEFFVGASFNFRVALLTFFGIHKLLYFVVNLEPVVF